MRPAGVVLAGGRSSRMGGGEKALLDLGGTALLDRVIARLAPQVGPLAINANRELGAYEARGFPVFPDTFGDYAGPLAGVLAAMRWAERRGVSRIVTVAGDTPFFPEDLVARLIAITGPDAPIAMAATPDPKRGMARHPTFALWPVALAPDLEASLAGGVRKIVVWTDKHGTAEALFGTEPYDPFFNVNTPDDMAYAMAIAAENGL